MFGGGANTNPRQSTRVTHAPGGKSNTAGLFGGDSASRTQQAAQQAQQRRHQATLDANYQHNTPAVSAMTGMTAGTPSQQGNWGTSVGGGQSTVDVFSHAGQGGYDNPYARGHKVGAKGKEAPGGPKTLSSDATAALFGAAAGAKVRAQEEALKEKYKVVSQGTSVGGGVNKPVKRKHSLWRVCAILGSPCFFFSLVYANARFAFCCFLPSPQARRVLAHGPGHAAQPVRHVAQGHRRAHARGPAQEARRRGPARAEGGHARVHLGPGPEQEKGADARDGEEHVAAAQERTFHAPDGFFCAFVSRHFPSDRSFPRGTPAFPPSCCCQAMLPQSQYRPAQQQRQAPFHQEAPQRGSVAAFARCCPVPYPVSPWGATQIPGF